MARRTYRAKTNRARADHAAWTVDLYQTVTGYDPEDVETLVTDLMTDLFHFAAQYDVDTEALATRSFFHFAAEVEEEAGS